MRRNPRQRRSGNILVLTAFMMIGMMAFLAMAVDTGYVLVTRTQIQRSADAAAIAAAWQLIEEGGWSGSPLTRATASRYAALNNVGKELPALDSSDVDIGNLANPDDPDEVFVYNDPGVFNAVDVRVQRTDEQNGEVPYFFARALGYDSTEVRGRATAAFYYNIHGFKTPSTTAANPNLDILPFALDEDTWDGLVAGTVLDDSWQWDKDAKEVLPGIDLEYEVNLFPQGTGSPGNRGTIDIGGANNSTQDIARQIVYGISPDDLAYHGGQLELDDAHEMELNGDTGISAGVKDELASMIGEKRIIPIFSDVVSPGNNAQYTIVKWVGVRIMEVKLTGPMHKKRVIVQPAKVVSYGTIPAEEGDPETSVLVYSPPRLAR